MGKSYGMSKEACQEVERRLADLKEYIRDEGGEPKSVLSGLMGGSAPEPSTTETDSEVAYDNESEPTDDKASKIAMVGWSYS
jgi:hypothetical protein